jgi:monoamine oxidase
MREGSRASRFDGQQGVKMAPRVNAIVIGAGLAGLRCAGDLAAKGKSVLVVEAQGRVGGRVMRGELCGRVIDHGAQWIGPHHARLFAEARRFGHETVLQYAEGKSILSLGGRRTEAKGEIPKLPMLALIELWMLHRRWNKEMKALPATAPWTTIKAREWDSQTLESWIKKNLSTKASRGFAQAVPQLAYGADASEVSYLWMLDMLRAAGGLEQSTNVKGGTRDAVFKGGAHAVAQNMADALGDRVVLSAPVRAIAQDESGVAVTTDKGVFEADHAVVAVPPALCSRIDFGGSLSAGREALSQRLPHGAVIKVHVAYKEPFWRRAGYSGHAASTDLPLALVMEDTQNEGTALLIGFIQGAQALALSQMGADEGRGRIVDCLVDLFGPQANEHIGYARKDWLADEWSRGGVGHMGPGVLTGYGAALRTSCGRVHWASSETATQWAGYMEGALQSGERAAQDVIARLSP